MLLGIFTLFLFQVGPSHDTAVIFYLASVAWGKSVFQVPVHSTRIFYILQYFARYCNGYICMMQRLIQDCTIGSKIPPLVTQDLFENTCHPSIKSVVNPGPHEKFQ